MVQDNRGKLNPVHTILVVEDEPAVLKAMLVLLEKSGFKAIGCATGEDALSKAGAGIEAALLDIHLPDMSGLDLSHQLRGVLGPRVPIVILSGDNSIETLRALPSAGATHFFSKPVKTAMLVEKLREWVARSAE